MNKPLTRYAGNSSLKVSSMLSLFVHHMESYCSPPGYKVGRVEQAETALGAEMRVAAEKAEGKGKAKAKAPAGDKIVRR